jgi:hypothetical protein
MAPVTKYQASTEMLRRQQARASLVHFSQALDIPGIPYQNADAELDKEDGSGKLIDRVVKSEIIYRPVELRVALHHVLMMQAIQRCILKRRGRLMIFAPPGSAKSTYAAIVGVVWAMGRMQDFQVILASYGAAIAAKQSRKVRSIAKDPRYTALWDSKPRLLDDQRAVDDWSLTNGSSLMTGGLLSGITGNRADLFVIDDPVANREQADSPTIREKTYNEFIDTVMTRAKPRMSCIIIQCMTGDTQVLMADGLEKPLREIKHGDSVASYKDGGLVAAKVLNWVNQGSDRIFAIKTASGKLLRANERHPFLVLRNGEQQWVRLRSLKTGDALVGAIENSFCAAQTDASATQSVKGCACPTITRTDGHAESGPPQSTPVQDAQRICDTATESVSKTMSGYLHRNMENVQFADNPPEKTSGRIGAESYASIIAMEREKSGDCSVMTATLQLDTEKLSLSCPLPLSMYETTLDTIVSIEADGMEDVFDIQVEGTENFIANGVVSHNTRWHEEDLSGSILPLDYNGESGVMKCRDGQEWEVLCIPAEAEREDDVLGRDPKSEDWTKRFLWPEHWPREHWSTWRDNPRAVRTWAALYQQRPAPFTGVHFNREMFKRYNPDMPRMDYI